MEILSRNSEYWHRRFLNLSNNAIKSVDKIVKRLERASKLTFQAIDNQLFNFYSRFSDLNNITLAEAKETLNKADLKAFRLSVDEYIALAKENVEHFNPKISKLLEEASLKVRVTRLEAAGYQMAGEVAKLVTNEHKDLYNLLSDNYIDRYYKTAFEIFKGYGVGTSFEMINPKKVGMILKEPWTTDGTNFSSKLWTNQIKLTNELNSILTSACIRGEGYDKTSKLLAQEMDSSFSNAKRVIVTESTYFSSRAQLDCYSELGAEQYKIIATLDNKTCPICQKQDGKVYPIEEFKAGETAPPFHPNDRCTTAPYFNNSNLPGYIEGTRTARNPETGKTYRVPRNMTYREWAKKYNIKPKYGKATYDNDLNDSQLIDNSE